MNCRCSISVFLLPSLQEFFPFLFDICLPLQPSCSIFFIVLRTCAIFFIGIFPTPTSFTNLIVQSLGAVNTYYDFYAIAIGVSVKSQSKPNSRTTCLINFPFSEATYCRVFLQYFVVRAFYKITMYINAVH